MIRGIANLFRFRHFWRDRRMWTRVSPRNNREMYYYYCNVWCYLTEHRLCKRPSRRNNAG